MIVFVSKAAEISSDRTRNQAIAKYCRCRPYCFTGSQQTI